MNTQAVVDLTQSLGWIISREKSELNSTQVFSFVGYKYHLDTALVKPTQERWLKLQDLILQLQVKTFFDCKMFDVSNWVASLNGENGPRGTSSHEALSVSPQGALEISSTLDSLLPWTEAISAPLDWWQNPANLMKGSDLHRSASVPSGLLM